MKILLTLYVVTFSGLLSAQTLSDSLKRNLFNSYYIEGRVDSKSVPLFQEYFNSLSETSGLILKEIKIKPFEQIEQNENIDGYPNFIFEYCVIYSEVFSTSDSLGHIYLFLFDKNMLKLDQIKFQHYRFEQNKRIFQNGVIFSGQQNGFQLEQYVEENQDSKNHPYLTKIGGCISYSISSKLFIKTTLPCTE